MTANNRLLARFVAVALMGVAVLLGASHPSLAQSKSLEWLRLDTEITVEPNGDLSIVETNVIRFTSGTFTFGFRDIDMQRLTAVRDVAVFEGDQPLRVETGITDGFFRIKYYFASPATNEERTFVLRYTVQGAVRYYEEGDQVWWAAVYADRNGFPVRNARAVVYLPPGAVAENAAVYGVPAAVSGVGERVVVAEAQSAVPNGAVMEIRVQFPHGVISGSPPPWQERFDAQRQFEETQKPLFNLIALLVTLLLLFGGPALAAALYVLGGRDPNVGLVAEYLTEPPPIPPGLAGVLVDERADMQDILATLADLGRRGVIAIREGENGAGWVIERGPHFNLADLQPYEAALVRAFNLQNAQSCTLSSLRNQFYKQIPRIQRLLYQALVRAGYYKRSPEQVRETFSALANLLIGLALVGGCFASAILSELTDFALGIPLGLFVTGVAFSVIAPHMPVRTRKGAEMRMRAEAFKRYLANLEKYTQVQQAKDLFERYLPWAVAFGLKQSWIHRFAQLKDPPPVPGWYAPLGFPRPYDPSPQPRQPTSVPTAKGLYTPRAPVPDVSDVARAEGVPSIESLEKGLGASLGNLEHKLSSMFDSVSTTLTSQPTPPPSQRSPTSSRRWSGGGFSSGGFSGGGRGGFG